MAAAASKVDVSGVFFNFGGVVGEGDELSDMPRPTGLMRRCVTALFLREFPDTCLISVVAPFVLGDINPLRDFFRPEQN